MLEAQDFINYMGEGDITLATTLLKKAETYAISTIGDFAEKDYTETHDGNGEKALILKKSPVVSVTTLKFGLETQDLSSFYIDKGAGIIRSYNNFPRGFNVIEVNYKAGWNNSTIPDKLKNAIFSLASKYYKAGDSLDGNISSENIDGASINWKNIDKSDEDKIFLSYKKIYV